MVQVTHSVGGGIGLSGLGPPAHHARSTVQIVVEGHALDSRGSAGEDSQRFGLNFRAGHTITSNNYKKVASDIPHAETWESVRE